MERKRVADVVVNVQYLKPVFFTICIFIAVQTSLVTAAEDTLILVQAVFRHGDRSPVHTFPHDRYRYTDSSYWPQGLGQLTLRGMRQEYNLGKFLQTKYMHEEKFLSLRYNHSEISVRSTDIDRTLMSAYCVLAGLYPPNNGSQRWNSDLNWQPIPVHTEPLDQDYLLNTDFPCPKFNELQTKFFAGEVIANFTAQHQDLINRAANVSGLPATLGALMLVLDPLYCEYVHGLNLSEWETVLPYDPVLLQFLDYEHTYLYYTTEMARLRGGPLLAKVIENMESALKPQAPTGPKVYLYSAHDTTLLGLLRVMNVFNNKSPVYSACILVELWQPSTGDGPYVQIFYRNVTDSNNTIPLQIPGCSRKCPLKDFNNILKNNVTLDVNAACNPKQPKPESKSDIQVGLVVLGCLVALLVLVVGALLTLLYRKRRISSYSALSTDDDDDVS